MDGAARHPTFGLFVFPLDVMDVGVEQLTEQVAAAGLDSVTVAASYHHGRDILPHNPRRRFAYHEGGVAYFQPTGGYGRLRPARSRMTRSRPVERTVAAARTRGLATTAWLVTLHNSRLGTRVPSATQEPAPGGRLLHALCPANPDVATYACALAADAARTGVDEVALEALTFSGFVHGSHHERSLTPVDDLATWLLGVCFCRWCVANGEGAGVDVRALRRAVTASIDQGIGRARRRFAPSRLEEVPFPDELVPYLQRGQRAVTDLVAAVSAAIRSDTGARATFLEPAAAGLGYATGRPRPTHSAASIEWQHGVDLPAIAAAVDRVGIAGYFADPQRLARELAAFRAAGVTRPSVTLRPMPPHARSAKDVARAIGVARDGGAAAIEFYHYALMPARSLSWIGTAVAESRTAAAA